MTIITMTVREAVELLRSQQSGGQTLKTANLPAAVREELKPYMGKREKESNDE